MDQPNVADQLDGVECPSHQILSGLALGRLSADTFDRVSAHVADCTACAAHLETLDDAADPLVRGLNGISPGELRPLPAELERQIVRAEQIIDREWGVEPVESTRAGQQAGTEVAAIAEPRSFGQYELLERIGAGGMGTVWKARHRRLRRTVAIKFLATDRARDAQAIARFEREMAAVGALDHPHLVRAHDAGEIEGQPFLVMEFVEGADLSTVVERLGKLSIADACEVVRQAAEGLQYAHEHGLVHRDIKPSNLMLAVVRRPSSVAADHGPRAADVTVKILDLGLALLHTADDVPGELTSAGQAMGTADYIAPEQTTDSHSVDIRADIYSLGCTLYKLLTGRAPFADPKYKTAFHKMMAHVTDEMPPVRSLRPEIPEGLAAVIARMVARQPADRFAAPRDVAAALEPFAAGADLGRLSAQAADRVGSGTEFETGTEPMVSSGSADTDERRRAMPPAEGVPGDAPRAPAGAPDVPAPKPAVRRFLPWTAAALALALLGSGLVFGVVVLLKNREGKVVGKIEVPEGITPEIVASEKRESGTPPTPAPASQPASPSPRPGIWALDFDGKTSCVRIPLVDLRGGKGFTMEAELLPEARGAPQWFNSRCALSSIEWRLCIEAKGEWRFSYAPGGASLLAMCAAPGEIGRRVHVAGVSDGKQLRLYLDGKLWQPRPLNRSDKRDSRAATPLAIGALLYGSDHRCYFAGQLREVRFSSVARYDKDFTPAKRFDPDEYTLALYHCDEGQGEVLHDSSRNANHGKIEGAKWVRVDNATSPAVADSPKTPVEASPVRSPTPPADGRSTPPLAKPSMSAAEAAQVQKQWADDLGIPVEQTNSIGMKFVLIPPGEFDMGSTEEEIAKELESLSEKNLTSGTVHAIRNCLRSETPRHRVRITRPFLLGIAPVTQGEYERIMKANPSAFTSKQMASAAFDPPLLEGEVRHRQDMVKRVLVSDTSGYPVETVLWNDAADFCRRLSDSAAEKAAGRAYRLPTEAEWEYACRAGTTGRRWCGDDDAALLECAWFCRNSNIMPHPVGLKRPNPWGLCDMYGNVAQWCSDCYADGYYKQSPVSDPKGFDRDSTSEKTRRVARGCATYSSDAYRCRSAFRDGRAGDHRAHNTGFRVACEIGATGTENPKPSISPE